MGFAKAAELNGYAGPKHVLELAGELDLTAEQRTRTQALFASMQTKAVALGRQLVDEERKLDRLFASTSITQNSLQESVARIGELQADVRAAHLEAAPGAGEDPDAGAARALSPPSWLPRTRAHHAH